LDMRRELRRHLASFEGTRLLVTHDPLEAMTLAGRIVILEEGRVVQGGAPQDILERPRSRYVADLVGRNLLRGTGEPGRVVLDSGAALVAPAAPRGDVFASVHPHSVALHRRRPEGTPRNVWSGRIGGLDPEGERVRVKVEGAIPIVAEVTPAAVEELRLSEGGEVWVSVKATEIEVYPA
ncbi:MAG: TOBE domain-containing protein, partial [Actinomycetota bacterium]